MEIDGRKGRVYEILRSLLEDGETVGIEVAESKLGGKKMLEPAHAFGTSKRLIIIRGGFLPFMQDFKIINYGNITEIIFDRGMFYSKVHFALQGELNGPSRQKWLEGLKYREALDLVRFVNTKTQKPVQETSAKAAAI